MLVDAPFALFGVEAEEVFNIDNVRRNASRLIASTLRHAAKTEEFVGHFRDPAISDCMLLLEEGCLYDLTKPCE